jgi:hypothetical protein
MRKILALLASLIFLAGCTSEIKEESITVTLYFVADTPRGLKLFSEKQEFTSSENLSESIIAGLVSGKIQPLDPDYINLWDLSHNLNKITITGNKANIDLNLGKLNVGSEGEQRAIDQLVWTLIDLNPKVKVINFSVNGETVETFAGHLDLSVGFKKAPAYEVLNPIQISSFSEGETLSNPIEISGEACTFEANLVWSLIKEGTVIDESFTTAEGACPLRSEWNITLGNLEPGTYLFEAKEFSAEDGSLFAIDSKKFSVK